MNGQMEIDVGDDAFGSCSQRLAGVETSCLKRLSISGTSWFDDFEI